MSKTVCILYDEAVCTVVGAFPELCEELHYTHRDFDNESKCTQERVVRLYHDVVGSNTSPTIRTFQGLRSHVAEFCRKRGYQVFEYDTRPAFVEPRLDLMNGFRFSQKELLTKGLLANMSGLIGAPTRYGKCLGRGTLVLMVDGTRKPVEDIREGDLVMGHDSTPRRAIGVVQGRDIMYRVTPNSGGESWVCTQDHLLVLTRTPQGGVSKSPNKDGREYIFTAEHVTRASSTFRHLHKLTRRAVEFPERMLAVDPYIYGLWLGDGTTNEPQITTADAKIALSIMRYAVRSGLSYRSQKHEREERKNKSRTYCLKKSCGKFWKGMERSGAARRGVFGDLVFQASVSGEKRILPEYLTASREQRLQLLAGYIDTDGYTNNGQAYAIITKVKKLSEDLLYLCRSLGFLTTSYSKVRSCHNAKIPHSDTYYEVHISGRVDEIPVRLERKKITGLKFRRNPLISGFKLECVGEEDYFGFELEGPDKLFLLGDFTVTHNTTLITNTLRAYPGLKTVVTAPGVDLLKQLMDDLKLKLPNRTVQGLFTGSKSHFQGEDITVVSMDSLEKCDFLGTKLVLIDEPHSAVTQSRGHLLNNFQHARRIGYGATLDGRYDRADILIQAIIGPVLVNRTYKEAVAEGAVAPIEVAMLKVRFPAFKEKDRDRAYKNLIWEQPSMHKLVAQICKEVFPANWQTLIFIKNEKQADAIHGEIPEGTVAMAKKLTTTERRELFTLMAEDKVKRCICSEIYSTGVTFHEVRALINAGGGGANIGCIQKPGRLAEIRPGKKCGVMIDFLWECDDPDSMLDRTPSLCAWNCVVRDSRARLKKYKDKGYNVTFHESVEGLAQYVRSCA